MILGILADTHSLALPSKLMERFKTVDLIIHAGDICDTATLKLLKSLAPLKAVQGNMDEALLKKQLPFKDIVVCEGFKIGVTHGHIGDTGDALANARALFEEEGADVVIFGHSHKACHQKIGSTLFFNPGSPNDVVKAKFFSYGIIEIAKGCVKPAIVKI